MTAVFQRKSAIDDHEDSVVMPSGPDGDVGVGFDVFMEMSRNQLGSGIITNPFTLALVC
ncbi:MAG: hypothetical protein U0798_18080 [Gemmataceae bacterium]